MCRGGSWDVVDWKTSGKKLGQVFCSRFNYESVHLGRLLFWKLQQVWSSKSVFSGFLVTSHCALPTLCSISVHRHPIYLVCLPVTHTLSTLRPKWKWKGHNERCTCKRICVSEKFESVSACAVKTDLQAVLHFTQSWHLFTQITGCQATWGPVWDGQPLREPYVTGRSGLKCPSR